MGSLFFVIIFLVLIHLTYFNTKDFYLNMFKLVYTYILLSEVFYLTKKDKKQILSFFHI
jgi:hypothetical protein